MNTRTATLILERLNSKVDIDYNVLNTDEVLDIIIKAGEEENEEDREIEFDILEEHKAKTRRLAETIIEMIDEDYDHEDIKSYIEQHLIIANKSSI